MPLAMAWYEESFGADYLDLYAHRDDDEAERTIAFVTRLFTHRPRAILDLACGAGRHTQALRAQGCRALGLDLSLELLARGPQLPRVAGDMRGLPFRDGTFDWVLNFFTSFGYFDTEPQNFKVLQEVVRVLEPGGRFLLDLMNLDATLAHLREYEVRQVAGCRVEIHRWWDARQRRLNKRIRYDAGAGEPRTLLESVRGYSRDEVEIGMRWAGLEVTETYGSFAGEPYGRDSERLILVGYRVG
jgi:SAM-dependent methyltransferase